MVTSFGLRLNRVFSEEKPITKAILITGAAKRIGRQLARELASLGWTVAVHYRGSETEALALVSEIRGAGGHAAAFAADLADSRSVKDLVGRVRGTIGPLTALINNASEFHPDTLQTLDETTWDKHLNTNLKAPVFLAQALAAQLPDGQEGNVINIVDQRVWNLSADFFSYTISKAGLWTATQTLAQSLAPRVRVNAIAPGPVLRSIYQTQEEFESEKALTLLRRGSTVEEIATAARFILSSPGLTGQMIALDGGQHLT